MKRTVTIVSTLLLVTGCFQRSTTPNKQPIETNRNLTNVQYIDAPTPKPLVISSNDAKPDKPQISKVTLAAIGDVLIHDKIYWDAAQNDGTYNFKPIFEKVKPFLQTPDILVANQETMIGGKALRLSSYPSFNSPHEVGDALKDSGVDLVTIANNHSLDRGEKVIQSALIYWDTLGIPYTGTFKSKNDRDKIRTMTKNEITFSFLSYTYGTNGIPTPKGKPFLINRINEHQIRQDVEQAKHMSDVVVVALHWGKEYQRFPDHEQTELAQKLAKMGVHIVIGNHPHVLQPPAWVYGENGHRTFVLYSLGNFISAQKDIYKQIGGMATIEVTKTKSSNQSTIQLLSPSFLPTFTHSRNGHQFRIMSMDTLTNVQLQHAAAHHESIKKHMRTYMQELQILSSSKQQ